MESIPDIAFEKTISKLRNEITKKPHETAKLQAIIEQRNKKKSKLETQKEKTEEQLKALAKPTKKTALYLAKTLTRLKDKDKAQAAKILDTFFEEVHVKTSNFEYHWKNLTSKLPDEKPETILAALFTQNSSPARLYRIWKEADEFWNLVLQRLLEPNQKWQRLNFAADTDKLGETLKTSTPYILQFKNLEPDTLLALHVEDGRFVTIESLGKFSFKGTNGAMAVKKALSEQDCYRIAEEHEPVKDLLDKPEDLRITIGKTENYCPLIEIVTTPWLLQVIVPAKESISVLNIINSLFNERFGKVIGKLPLNAGLLVADRKFPLYLLLEAARKMLRHKDFEESLFSDPWWDISAVRNDRYRCHYPTKKLGQDAGAYPLDYLTPLSKGRPYALYPGYFDFSLVRGSEERHNLAYENRKRAHGDYVVLSVRPCYFYRLEQMIDLWEILNNNLSTSQIHFISEAISSKKLEWRNINDQHKNHVVNTYAETILLDAFGAKWIKLSEETRHFIMRSAKNNLLLDTIVLFQQVIKDEGGN